MVLDPERKFADTTGSVLVDNMGFVAFLNGAFQGVGSTQRIGLQHLNVSIYVQWMWLISTGNDAAYVRLALVHDKQPNGSLMAVTELWQNTASTLATMGNRVLGSALRFTVLWDKKQFLEFGHQQARGRMFKRIRLKSRFTDASGGITSIASGALILVAITDVSGTATPNVRFTTRTRFVG